jgi:glycine/betaine/sarcosine/D-proline reductase family selenoprotein B
VSASIARELKRAGLPTGQVWFMPPAAVMIGAKRIGPAAGLIHPLGTADRPPQADKARRRRIAEQPRTALRTEGAEPTVFTRE